MSEELISRDDIVGLIGERVLNDALAERSVAAIGRAAAAKAWDEGWSARASRGYAHLKVGECVPPPAHINPYRKEQGNE